MLPSCVYPERVLRAACHVPHVPCAFLGAVKLFLFIQYKTMDHHAAHTESLFCLSIDAPSHWVPASTVGCMNTVRLQHHHASSLLSIEDSDNSTKDVWNIDICFARKARIHCDGPRSSLPDTLHSISVKLRCLVETGDEARKE